MAYRTVSAALTGALLTILLGSGVSGASPLCGSTEESLVPTTADEETLVSYFQAVSDGDYPTAWGLLGDYPQSVYGSQRNFADVMFTHVACVRVLDAVPLGGGEYRLVFADQYTVPFPAGSGSLPLFWTVADGQIAEFGTGP